MTTSRRTTAGLAAAAVLSLTALAFVPSAAGPAAGVAVTPTADCTTPYDGSGDDYAALVGEPITGLTVVTGTTPTPFHGAVLGVLDQGIDLATPLIMVRLGTHGITDGSTPSAADEAIAADGVWEGMSGSPVYYGGQLVGAVSTGLAQGNTDIIGITPATAMLPFLPRSGSSSVATAASRARVAAAWSHPTTALRHELAQAAGISTVRAAQGLRPLTTLTERGLGPAALAGLHQPKARGVHTGLTTGRIAGTTGTGAPVSTMVAGGNAADMIVWGDYAEGAIGTVTTVCDGALVAFGHPVAGTGPANDALVSASVVTVQPDPLGVSFKVANLGLTAGRITQDVSTAVGGRFGALPSGVATFTHTASYDGGPARTGTSYSADRGYWIDAAYTAADANDYTVMKAWRTGGAVVGFRIMGTDHGTPYTIAYTDRYASTYSIADDSLTDVAQAVYALGSMPGVTVTKVTTTSAINDTSTQARVSGLQQKVGSTWTKVDSTHPAKATAGHNLYLRVAVTVNGATSYLPVTLGVPTSVKGGHGSIRMLGGNASALLGEDTQPSTAAALKQLYAAATRNDQVGVTASFTKGSTHASVSKRTAASSHVIGGSLTVPVTVG